MLGPDWNPLVKSMRSHWRTSRRENYWRKYYWWKHESAQCKKNIIGVKYLREELLA